jgi:tripartite ATP-independent transporter DctM subunit
MVPAMPEKEIENFKKNTNTLELIKTFILPFILIFSVLGSIFMGIASPTEAAGIGALGALILSYLEGGINLKKIDAISVDTMKLTSIVFMILLGATSFSLVFRGLEGDKFIIDLIYASNLSPEMFTILVLLIVFVAGFFIDFIEIIFIIVPVITPILIALNIDLLWIGIMLAINLQTSFLTPPFGFSLFYLKSVSPKEIKTTDIYMGIIPFVIIQIVFLIFLFFNPDYIYIIPDLLKS